VDRLLAGADRSFHEPQMMWIPLTEDEKKNIFLKWYGKHWAYTKQLQNVMESVEAKLKEKNEQTNRTGHRDEHGSRYDPFVRNSRY
jgi:hypothetical protein